MPNSAGAAGSSSTATVSSSSGSSSSTSSARRRPAAAGRLNIAMDGNAEIVDEDTYVTGSYTLPAVDGQAALGGRLSIKGHGNTTWGFPKKPYRVKLDDKAPLLGMPKDKNWILLADYSDKTLLRTRLAFEVSRRFGLAWTPRAFRSRSPSTADMTASMTWWSKSREDKNRVNVTETDGHGAGRCRRGGYLLEINERMDDPVCWRTARSVALCIKEPDPGRSDQQAYIRDYVQAAEDSLYATDTTAYQAYFDVDSLIDWYLVEELLKNPDSNFFASVYLYKDKDGKLTFGPVWDFDISAGNGRAETDGFLPATALWIARMKASDPTFETRVRARWDALKADQIDTLPAFIDAQAAALQGAQGRNFTRWPIIGVYVWPNSEIAGSYDGEVDYLKTWLAARTAWLDANL